MKRIVEEYGSVIVGVIGAILVLGIIATSFMNNGLLARFIYTFFNKAF